MRSVNTSNSRALQRLDFIEDSGSPVSAVSPDVAAGTALEPVAELDRDFTTACGGKWRCLAMTILDGKVNMVHFVMMEVKKTLTSVATKSEVFDSISRCTVGSWVRFKKKRHGLEEVSWDNV